MTAPRLEIDLGKLRHNARTLVERLQSKDIAVTGVTKAILGSPEIATVLLEAGVSGLGDSRIENLEKMRRLRVPGPMTLIRSPMLSQVDRVVRSADTSFNTEPAVIAALSAAAVRARRAHGVVLMVEFGDLREGIMPVDLEGVARQVLALRNIELRGIGTNLACQSGVEPGARNMAELSALTRSIEAACGQPLATVSGGNSANLKWALGSAAKGRVNDLRLGESILLGRDPLDRSPIEGLYTDAILLAAEVIELKVKPSQPWGAIAQTAFGDRPRAADRGSMSRAILALGIQDADPDGLTPPPGTEIIGASSDHLILDAGETSIRVGSEVAFQLNYGALVRAMTSLFVARFLRQEDAGRQFRREISLPIAS